MSPDAESMQLLTEARDKAAALLASLSNKRAELDAWMPSAAKPRIDPQSLAKGQFAIHRAVQAAQEALQRIDDVIRSASVSSN